MRTYLDSSLVVSLYAADANSIAAVAALLHCLDTPVLSVFCELEVMNALSAKAFRNEISIQESKLAIDAFERDARAGLFKLTLLPKEAFPRARKLTQSITPQTGIRSADLLHIAIALELGVVNFLSFDRLQRRVAEDAGLVLNPLP